MKAKNISLIGQKAPLTPVVSGAESGKRANCHKEVWYE